MSNASAIAPTLNDRYDMQHRRVFVSGMQTIVRMLLEQHERDYLAGLNTGGFISGYRGSPIGRLDSELTITAKLLVPRSIHFQPGVNEELAATAVWGSQQAHLLGDANVDGVFGLWYGKGPGVDRSGDAFKHANLAGTSPKGGVVVIAGDDPSAKSSTTAHQSEQSLVASMIPVLVPASLQELLDFGLLAFAMSRFSGCWVALKVATQVADASSSVESSLGRLEITTPREVSAEPLHVRWPDDRLAMERRLVGPKLDAVRAFARANNIDQIVWDPPFAQVGIVTSGRSHFDVMEALQLLGIDAARAETLGIRLYKVGMSWPLEPEGAKAFAEGLDRILVVEEKRSLIETQLKEQLYNSAGARPTIIGKTDATGRGLLPQHGELSPRLVAETLSVFFSDTLSVASQTAPMETEGANYPDLVRTEFFCAGCPHNRSTKLPEGSVALAGIGCHTMAAKMLDRPTVTICQMGGEGASWIGQAPFSTRQHVFQNIGDGTYFHSGFLAIRASIAAKVNITYKLLLNDAVAMTGGQPVEGTLGVEAICTELLAEGATRVIVVTDEPDAVRALPSAVAVRPRREMDAVQRELKEIEGVTVLIYQQVCAAEKRRRRKRKLMPDPDRRIFINERVCEGCGDCVKQSSCIAVAPVATPLGRKRQIDQYACNKDFSCVEGFCPSFVEVEGGRIRRGNSSQLKAWLASAPALPALHRAAGDAFHVLITGIGGTGVVTVGAVLAMAAHLDGSRVQTLDQTGLAQKNGAVSSHVTIAAPDMQLGPVQIGAAATDVLIACDVVVAASPDMLALTCRERTSAVINADIAPTASQTFDLKASLNSTSLPDRLSRKIGTEAVSGCNASEIARALLGDAVFSNMLMLGFAWQNNELPVTLSSLRQAIELNGAAVDGNLMAFELGRHLAHNGPDVLDRLSPRPAPPQVETFEVMVDKKREMLTSYQNKAYADLYGAWVERFVEAEAKLGIADNIVSRVVAFSLARLMAYKDEYEVSRLYTDGIFRAALDAQFEGIRRQKLYLAPPLLSPIDPVSGRPKKRAFGPWILTALSLLARFKWLRGTVFDPFGYSTERRNERALITEYMALMEEVLASLSADQAAEAVTLLAAVDDVRGYGPVKDANLVAYHTWLQHELDRWRSPRLVRERFELESSTAHVDAFE